MASEKVEFLKASLQNTFDIHIWMLVPAVVVIVLLAMRKPSVPTIAIGALLGAIWAAVFQGMDFADAIGTAYNGFSIDTGIKFMDELLNRGGIEGMLGDQIDDGKRCFHLMHPLIHVGYPIFQLGLHIMYFAVVEAAQLHMFFIEL